RRHHEVVLQLLLAAAVVHHAHAVVDARVSDAGEVGHAGVPAGGVAADEVVAPAGQLVEPDAGGAVPAADQLHAHHRPAVGPLQVERGGRGGQVKGVAPAAGQEICRAVDLADVGL